MAEARGSATAQRIPEGGPQIMRATDLTGVHILKHDNLFMLCDAYGDVHIDSRGLGLYERDTRVLSLYELRLNGIRPVVLRAGPAVNYRGTIQMTNPDLFDDEIDGLDPSAMVLRRHSLGVVRDRVIGGGFGERITVENYTAATERARLTLRLDVDYADIFELRGFVRERRGERLATEGDGGLLTFAYRGLDDAMRRTHVRLMPQMRVVGTDGLIPAAGPVVLELDQTLQPGEKLTISVDVWTELPLDSIGQTVVMPPAEDEELSDDGSDYAEASDASDASVAARASVNADEPAATHRAWRTSSASIETDRVLADRAFERSSADLRLLMNTGPGPDERYVAAGVPWFCGLFGRDSLITALQTVFVRPQLARWTLMLLARLQATEVDDWRDAEPGKILHELREGELAAAGEIPQGPYYGSIDATPLWLMLLDAYERWTADSELVDRLWPNAMAALRWMDEYGDLDGDGLLEYSRRSRDGLLHQGWKDSPDAIQSRDGRPAESPVALVEVQAYAYAARRAVARLAGVRGDDRLAATQLDAAEKLRQRFEDQFWMDDAGTYALALDGSKMQVNAVASNAGHALWAGIASPERAASVARTLMGPGMWTGWGIRTLSGRTAGYNPIGYHSGTVWPHDNAIAAAGFARYGLTDEARRVAGAMLEATMHFREARLPELFCGFDRDQSPMPVPFPVACAPQAWAAGSLFQILGALLGLQPNAREKRLEIVRPSLPDALPSLRLRNLRVGEAVVDIHFSARDGSPTVEVERRTGDLDVVVRL
ncbi:MAG: glycogen debranching N-terminal domain-containing protein [Candidatus Limnocylindrales bacterium]